MNKSMKKYFPGVGLLVAASVLVGSCQVPPEGESNLVLASGYFDSEKVKIVSKKSANITYDLFWAEKFGRSAEVFLAKAGRGIVFDDSKKTLRLKNLKLWKKFKNSSAEFEFDAESKIEAPLGRIRYRKFNFMDQECFQFAHQFGRTTEDDEDRMKNQIEGYFCDKPFVALSISTMTEFLHQIGVTRFFDPRPK